jgi:2,4-dienoyl-CoA reductase-like NADH-dependent reductase (Old Yellow Enzyme family)
MQASGLPGVPGIFTDEQKAGWRRVVDAVHEEGGIFLMQRLFYHIVLPTLD